MVYDIQALETTHLKKSTAQSSDLDMGQKRLVPQGRVFPVREYKLVEDGHYQVELDYQAGTWYIFAAHWDLPWEDSKEEDTGVGAKHLEELRPDDAPQSPREVDWLDPESRVSKYFRVYEVTQGDDRRLPRDRATQNNILELARELDRVREQWAEFLQGIGSQDSPALAVTSWYRPPEINRAVGGVENSQHITGSASDIRPVNGDVRRFQVFCDKMAWSERALGYGAPLGFVHLDLRQGRIRWHY